MIQREVRGVCSRYLEFDLDDEKRVHGLKVQGGCRGNLIGIAQLVEGMPAEEVIERLSGIDCAGKGTSCPDQFARVLKEELNKAKSCS